PRGGVGMTSPTLTTQRFGVKVLTIPGTPAVYVNDRLQRGCDGEHHPDEGDVRIDVSSASGRPLSDDDQIIHNGQTIYRLAGASRGLQFLYGVICDQCKAEMPPREQTPPWTGLAEDDPANWEISYDLRAQRETWRASHSFMWRHTHDRQYRSHNLRFFVDVIIQPYDELWG
ncbi:hypothetical protein, partial [Mycolicibacterium llatzerense]